MKTIYLFCKALPIFLFLITPLAMAHPDCVNPASDPDNDGWGWENDKTCVVREQDKKPTPTESSNQPTNQNTGTNICSSNAINNGDGWGWENQRSCKFVTPPSTSPATPGSSGNAKVCSSKAINNGDGWGWENDQSCQFAPGTPDPTPSNSNSDSDTNYCSSNAIDSDGDGWGWENKSSCKMPSSGQNPPPVAVETNPVENDYGKGVLFAENFEYSQLGTYRSQDVKNDFGDLDWTQGFDEGRVSIVNQGSQGKALRVKYLGGKANPSAGAQFPMTIPGENTELFLSYSFKFHQNFEFKIGGKLPGLCGRILSGGPGCQTGGGYPDGVDDGWSARLMWRENGAMENYVYHVDQDEEWGDKLVWSKKLQSGIWYRIHQRIKLNTVGEADGIIQTWVGDELVLDETILRFRESSAVKINVLYFSTFFGGSGEKWAPKEDQYIYFDDFVISKNPIRD